MADGSIYTGKEDELVEYLLMRKDEAVTLCEVAEDGTMVAYAKNYRNPELAPLEYRASKDHIARWWRARQIPLSQGRVEEMLRQRGLAAPGEFLIRNLGLSLTDYYWMKPVDSALRWADVNLFENDFRENILVSIGDSSPDKPHSCTPNSSLRGELEKSWVIRCGKRVLIKGNHGSRSTESINEVIASGLHMAQRYTNHTKYQLIHIKDKPYDYGCWSEAFTNTERELVSAHALLTSAKKPAGMSDYEFLIELGARGGLDEKQFRRDLEYQIMTDYLLSNVDRHMDNIGILRDAKTLKFIRMAPIFDTGKAFGGGNVIPYTEEEIDSIETNSFEGTERELLALVRDKSVIDMSRLLPQERIEELCMMDSKASRTQTDHIVRLYNKKAQRILSLS
jgi:hypothetical protein